MIRFEIVDPAATRELRRSVLRPDTSVDDTLPGDDLTGAIHVGAIDDDGVVACTCFVYADPCPWQPDRPDAWHLRQMATLPTRRGQGLGGGVVERSVELARERGAALLWCNAREPAVAFYARHRFTAFGDIFTDGQHSIRHQRMWRELADPPARELSGPPTSSTR